MSELNRLLRQAARITAGVSPNTDRSVEDHKDDASYVTALATEKKASLKKADADPNTDQAEEDHKGDAAYETALNPKVGSKRKLAEFSAPEPEEEVSEALDAETSEEDTPQEDVIESVTNADLVEALEDVKQGVMDAQEEAGEGPAADLLAAIHEIIEAVDAIQDAVSVDAMNDPAAEEAFKTASNFKKFFINERNIKAAKVIRQKLAAHQAATAKAPAPKKASVKKAFDPAVLARATKKN